MLQKHMLAFIAAVVVTACVHAETVQKRAGTTFLDSYDQLSEFVGQPGLFYVRDAAGKTTGLHGDPELDTGWAVYLWDTGNGDEEVAGWKRIGQKQTQLYYDNTRYKALYNLISSKYTKPTDGIPASDLEDEFQPSGDYATMTRTVDEDGMTTTITCPGDPGAVMKVECVGGNIVSIKTYDEGDEEDLAQVSVYKTSTVDALLEDVKTNYVDTAVAGAKSYADALSTALKSGDQINLGDGDYAYTDLNNRCKDCQKIIFTPDAIGMIDDDRLLSITLLTSDGSAGTWTNNMKLLLRELNGSTNLGQTDFNAVAEQDTEYIFTFEAPVSLTAGTTYEIDFFTDGDAYCDIPLQLYVDTNTTFPIYCRSGNVMKTSWKPALKATWYTPCTKRAIRALCAD